MSLCKDWHRDVLFGGRKTSCMLVKMKSFGWDAPLSKKKNYIYIFLFSFFGQKNLAILTLGYWSPMHYECVDMLLVTHWFVDFEIFQSQTIFLSH